MWALGRSGSGESAIGHYDGGGWTAVTPAPTSSELQGLWGSGPNDVWAVGSAGALVHYDGSSWTELVSSPTSERLTSIWGSGPNDIWAVGFGGTILHFDGAGWNAVSPAPTTDDVYLVWGTGPDDVWASAAENGTFLHYDGSGWSNLGQTPAAGYLSSFFGFGPSDTWALTGSGFAQNDGAGWLPVSGSAQATAAWGVPSALFVVGANGEINRLDRTVPWNCQPAEASCGDKMDNDCDDLIDVQDPDCASCDQALGGSWRRHRLRRGREQLLGVGESVRPHALISDGL